MLIDKEKEKEFENILHKFTGFIRIHLLKFYPYRYGLDTDDLFQEIKIKIWKILQNEKKINNLASYIKKIIDSTVIDQIRKIKREENFFSAELGKKASELKTKYQDNPIQENELKELIGQAVDSLIETRKKAVKLFLLNMSIEEIAEFYNWSRDKTRNLLYRGLTDLKNKLKDMIEIDENQI
jgi:RNA polymerase sigma-70 factor (ECF subfamily)